MKNILTVITFFICTFKQNVDGLERIVDLTWDFDNKTIYWKGIRPFSYTKKISDEGRGYWYAMNEFCAGEHGGTHFDAPYHFNKVGWKVGDIPSTRLIVKGVLVDLRNVTKLLNGSTTLEAEHLENWEKLHGNFEEGTVLLVRFGWSQYWGNKNKYFGVNENGTFSFPGVSKSAAEWIAKSKKFYGIGLDTPSIDPGNSTEFMAHRIFGKNQIYVLENVKIVDDLPVKGFTLLVMPMKLREGTGAPLRLFAITENF